MPNEKNDSDAEEKIKILEESLVCPGLKCFKTLLKDPAHACGVFL